MRARTSQWLFAGRCFRLIWTLLWLFLNGAFSMPGRLLIPFLLIACAAPDLPARAQEAPPARPDIVVILADDMGFSDIGTYGGEIPTPVLDRLAAGGVRFSQFYNAGRCVPTRAALLTGLYPHQAGLGLMEQDKGRPAYRGDLAESAVTIAEVLRRSGYGTYMAGKWHVTSQIGPWTGDTTRAAKRHWPLGRGFDRFYGTVFGAGSYYDPVTLVEDERPLPTPEGDYYYTDAIAARAAGYVAEHVRTSPERPFFLYVAFTAPHWPLHAPEADVARHRDRYAIGWDSLRQARHARLDSMELFASPVALPPRDPAVPAWDSLDADEQRWYAGGDGGLRRADRPDGPRDRAGRAGARRGRTSGQHAPPVPLGQRRHRGADHFELGPSP